MKVYLKHKDSKDKLGPLEADDQRVALRKEYPYGKGWTRTFAKYELEALGFEIIPVEEPILITREMFDEAMGVKYTHEGQWTKLKELSKSEGK